MKTDTWKALRAVGGRANQRLYDAQASDARPAPDVAAFASVVGPTTAPDGQHVPGLRFGDARVMAVLAAIVGFVHLIAGFDSRSLTSRVAALLDMPYSSRQATYDLRLRRKGIIVRLPGHHRYQLTPLGRRVAVQFTKAYGRVLAPGLTMLDPTLTADIRTRNPLVTAWRDFDHALDRFIANGLAAA